MKFTKLNDNTIKCQISEEELEQRGLHIEDILDDRTKAEEFLQEVLNEAKEEAGFDVSGAALNVQLSVMKDGNISLLISDDRNAAIRALLDTVKEKLSSFLSQLSSGQVSSENVVDIPSNQKPPLFKPLSKSAKELNEAAKDVSVTLHIWAQIESMEKCIALSKALNGFSDIDYSRLYSYKDKYYFELKMTNLRQNLASKIFSISEYSSLMFSDDGIVMEIHEHGRRLIKDNAFEVLAEMD